MPDLPELVDRFQRDLLREERQAAAAMVRAYGKTWKRIQADLARLDREYRRALARGEKPGASWIYEHNRLESFRKQVEGEMSKFTQIAEGKISAEQKAAIERAEKQSRQLVGMFERFDRQAVQAVIGMVQNGSPLHDLLAGISFEGSQAAEQALLDGMLLGKSPNAVARELRRVLGTTLTRALTIARTETLRAHRLATQTSYRANSDLITGWIWHASTDENTCACCWAMHGTVHTLDEQLDGHPNCRCAMVPIIKGVTFDVPVGEKLFSELPATEQIKILGPSKYTAWKDGKVSFDRDPITGIVGQSYDPRWGRMHYERSLKEILGIDRAKIYYKALPVTASDATRLTSLANQLLPEIERELGLTSYWSGKLSIESLPGAYGVKNWNCTIGIDRAAIRAGGDTERTVLLHELLHSFSVGGDNKAAFMLGRGWEEGIVEGTQRAMNSSIYKKLAIDSKPGRWAYNLYVDALDVIRLELGMSETDFYYWMMRTKLAARRETILQLSMHNSRIKSIIESGVLDK